jgi:hypothetical protein
MKIKDLAGVLENAPAGRWIAVSRDGKRLLGSGKTVNEAISKSRSAGEPKPLIVKAPKENKRKNVDDDSLVS